MLQFYVSLSYDFKHINYIFLKLYDALLIVELKITKGRRIKSKRI